MNVEYTRSTSWAFLTGSASELWFSLLDGSGAFSVPATGYQKADTVNAVADAGYVLFMEVW